MKQKGVTLILVQLLCQELALESHVGRDARRGKKAAFEIPQCWNMSLAQPSVLTIKRITVLLFFP